jgi:hypothetical protein
VDLYKILFQTLTLIVDALIKAGLYAGRNYELEGRPETGVSSFQFQDIQVFILVDSSNILFQTFHLLMDVIDA